MAIINCKFESLYIGCNENWNTVRFHKHNCFELVYYINGRGSTVIDGKNYDYGPNTFTFIHPNTLHDEHNIEKTNLFYLTFSYDNNNIKIHNGLFADNVSNDILNILKTMKAEIRERKINYDLRLNLLMQDLLIQFSRITEQKVIAQDSFLYAQKYIRENYNKNIHFTVLAESLGYSYGRFRHAFKERFSKTPTQYLIDMRVKNCIKLIRGTTTSLSEISKTCGFTSPSQMGSFVKRKTGSTPTQLRKM